MIEVQKNKILSVLHRQSNLQQMSADNLTIKYTLSTPVSQR